MKQWMWTIGGMGIALGCAVAILMRSPLGVASAEASTPAPEGEGTLSVTAKGAPAANVDIFLLVNQGKRPLGTTNAVGQLSFDPALLTGKVRVQVAVRECPDRKEVYVVRGEKDDACREVEEASNEDEDCRCDVAGIIWWGSRLRVDVTELTASGNGAPLTSNPLLWGGIAGAGVATGIAVSGGGSAATTSVPVSSPGSSVSTTTTAPPTTTTSAAAGVTGTYDIRVVSVSDPGGHRSFTGDPPPVIDIRATNGNFTATGSAPWVRVDGTIDNTGKFQASGRGTVAGFPGTMVLFEGTIEMASPHRLTGSYCMGTGGELPGGQQIEFRLQGQRR